MCERPALPRLALCERCRRELAPTPLGATLHAFGMTLDEVAELTGLGRATVSRCAAGKPISRASAEALAEVAQVAPEELMRGSPPPLEILDDDERRRVS